MLAEFSLKHVYTPPCVGKIYEFMMFTFLENALNLGIFTQVPSHLKLSPKLLSSYPGQREITHSHRQHFFQKPVSPTAEKGGAKYDLLYQNSIKKMKMT